MGCAIYLISFKKNFLPDKFDFKTNLKDLYFGEAFGYPYQLPSKFLATLS